MKIEDVETWVAEGGLFYPSMMLAVRILESPQQVTLNLSAKLAFVESRRGNGSQVGVFKVVDAAGIPAGTLLVFPYDTRIGGYYVERALSD